MCLIYFLATIRLEKPLAGSSVCHYYSKCFRLISIYFTDPKALFSNYTKQLVYVALRFLWVHKKFKTNQNLKRQSTFHSVLIALNTFNCPFLKKKINNFSSTTPPIKTMFMYNNYTHNIKKLKDIWN